MTQLAESKKAQILGAITEIDDVEALDEIRKAAYTRMQDVGRAAFSVGDRVQFVSSKGQHAGQTIRGKVVRVNDKTCTLQEIEDADGHRLPYRQWRVGFSLLEPAS